MTDRELDRMVHYLYFRKVPRFLIPKYSKKEKAAKKLAAKLGLRMELSSSDGAFRAFHMTQGQNCLASFPTFCETVVYAAIALARHSK